MCTVQLRERGRRQAHTHTLHAPFRVYRRNKKRKRWHREEEEREVLGHHRGGLCPSSSFSPFPLPSIYCLYQPPRWAKPWERGAKKRGRGRTPELNSASSEETEGC